MALRRTMAAYRCNGARPGRRLIPVGRVLEVWKAQGEDPIRIVAAESLNAAPVCPGLTIGLAEIWAG